MAESKVQTNGMVNGEGVRRDAIGMTCELINLYQKIDKDGNWSWSKDVPNITAAAEDEETAKFALLVRNKKSNDSRKSLELDSIIVQSPLVKEALATVLKDYPGITTNLKRLEFSSPFRPFVHRWERLVEVLSELQDETAKSHFQILHDVLYGELKDAIAVRNDLVANKVITFEHLWTIFEPASLVYSMDDGQERLYELSSSSQSYDSFRGLAYLRLSCVSVDWDGEKFGRRDESLLIYEFDGTEKIAKLSAYPLIFHQDPLKLSDRLVLRGKQFELFAGYHYMAYKGIALSSGPCGPVKHSVRRQPQEILVRSLLTTHRLNLASSLIALRITAPCPIKQYVSVLCRGKKVGQIITKWRIYVALRLVVHTTIQTVISMSIPSMGNKTGDFLLVLRSDNL